MRSGRIKRARLLTAALSCTAVLLAACSGNAASGVVDPTKPVRGGNLTFLVRIIGPCIDPQFGGFDAQAAVAHSILDNLVYENATGEIQPWLAKSWTISPDGLVYTFNLRDDVKFTDGAQLNAAAVKANLDRVMDPKTQAATDDVYLGPILKSTEVVSDYVLKVNLKKAYGELLHFLAQTYIGIESPAAFSRGVQANCAAPVGTGPFKVEKFTPNSEVRLVRNENYNSPPPGSADTGAAYVDRVVVKVVGDATIRYAALNNGQADVVDSPPPQTWKTISDSANQGLLAKIRSGTPNVILFGVTKPPLDDVRVRQAINYAANVRASLQGAFFGAYEYAAGPLSVKTAQYSAGDENRYEYNPSKAAQLLDEAGWTGRDADGYRTKGGTQLKVHVYYSSDMGFTQSDVTMLEDIQSYLKESGINLVLTSGSYVIIGQMLAVKSITKVQDFNAVAGWYWPTNTPDVLRFTYGTDGLQSGSNINGYSDPALDGVLRNALVAKDPQERQTFYAKAQQLISDAALSLPMYAATTRLAYSKSVHGLTVDNALGQPNFNDVWIAK